MLHAIFFGFLKHQNARHLCSTQRKRLRKNIRDLFWRKADESTKSSTRGKTSSPQHQCMFAGPARKGSLVSIIQMKSEGKARRKILCKRFSLLLKANRKSCEAVFTYCFTAFAHFVIQAKQMFTCSMIARSNQPFSAISKRIEQAFSWDIPAL